MTSIVPAVVELLVILLLVSSLGMWSARNAFTRPRKATSDVKPSRQETATDREKDSQPMDLAAVVGVVVKKTGDIGATGAADSTGKQR